MNKVKTFSIIASSAILFSSIASGTVSAEVYDNNGDAHQYIAMASQTISNPNSFFPAGRGTVSGSWVPIYANGGVISHMVPQYNRNITVNNAREQTRPAGAGFYWDGVVSCDGGTKYSDTKSSYDWFASEANTGWIWANNNSVYYAGWVYWDR